MWISADSEKIRYTGRIDWSVPKKTDKRIEVYGDSVSAGEVSEAVDFVGKEDPEHEGGYSNGY